MKESDPDVARVEAHVEQLMEHFDSVQIVATRYDGTDGETTTVTWGSGNWHARMGSVQAWLDRESEDRE